LFKLECTLTILTKIVELVWILINVFDKYLKKLSDSFYQYVKEIEKVLSIAAPLAIGELILSAAYNYFDRFTIKASYWEWRIATSDLAMLFLIDLLRLFFSIFVGTSTTLTLFRYLSISDNEKKNFNGSSEVFNNIKKAVLFLIFGLKVFLKLFSSLFSGSFVQLFKETFFAGILYAQGLKENESLEKSKELGKSKGEEIKWFLVVSLVFSVGFYLAIWTFAQILSVFTILNPFISDLVFIPIMALFYFNFFVECGGEKKIL